MSMLAERKSKQRWSLNPRGAASPWVNDKTNFGHKMLEKMGWSHGKGLGANETGVTEPIKIGYKNDNKGMGYKEKDDQWRDHDVSFNALLETLTNNLDTNGIGGTQPVSLEEKSQTSKARVHYKKFTRGKDLSRYSEKDLANIFGKKSLNSPKTQNTDEPIQPIQKATVESSFLHNSGSMVDYFKQKLAKFQGTPQRDESDDDNEKPARLGFGFASESINNEPENGKKRKLDGESGGEVKKKKKKKKIEEAAIDNPVFDETLNSEDTSNTNFEVVREKKKAKKKKESYENPVFNGNDSNLDTTQESCSTSLEVVRKKVKKTKKMEEATNLAFDANLDTSHEISNTNFEVKRDGKKSKKKRKIADSAVDNPVFNGNDAVSEPLNESNNVKKKSKKKADSVENSPVDITKKKKKKKKLSDQGIDNAIFNGDTTNSPNTDYDKKFEVSRKIHKHSKIPIDNPCFNDNSDCSGTLNQTPPPSTTSITITSTVQEEISCDLMMNTITTPILKTPSSRQDSKRGKNKNKNVRFSEINQQHIIPNKEDQQKLSELADINTQIINSNLKKFSKRIDGLEAEIENDMNEAKLEQIHNNTDDNKEGDGGVLIKFSRESVKFAPLPIWLRNVQCKAKSSYKHLIRTDFVVNFKNTNFGEIEGYGTNTNNKN